MAGVATAHSPSSLIPMLRARGSYSMGVCTTGSEYIGGGSG